MQPISIRSIDRGWYYVAVDGARPVGLGAWVRSMGCNILSAPCRSIDSRVPALSTPRTLAHRFGLRDRPCLNGDPEFGAEPLSLANKELGRASCRARVCPYV